jgi:hypothetical protein
MGDVPEGYDFPRKLNSKGLTFKLLYILGN